MREKWFNEEFLRNNYQFVLSFRNIIDYINWSNPIIAYDTKKVNRGVKVWEKIKDMFKEYGWVAVGDIKADIVLGGVYDGEKWRYRLLSDKPVRIPHIPSVLVLETPGKVLYFEPNNRKIYVNLLKKLIKAVIVRADI